LERWAAVKNSVTTLGCRLGGVTSETGRGRPTSDFDAAGAPAVGAASGMAALGGTAAVMASDRRAAKIAAGSPVTAKVLSPVTVTVEKE
jgi:hypothetical protein